MHLVLRLPKRCWMLSVSWRRERLQAGMASGGGSTWGRREHVEEGRVRREGLGARVDCIVLIGGVAESWRALKKLVLSEVHACMLLQVKPANARRGQGRTSKVGRGKLGRQWVCNGGGEKKRK